MVGAASLSAVRTSGGLAWVEWIGPGCSPIALHVPIECGGGKLSYVYVSASAFVWSMVTCTHVHFAMHLDNNDERLTFNFAKTAEATGDF